MAGYLRSTGIGDGNPSCMDEFKAEKNLKGRSSSRCTIGDNVKGIADIFWIHIILIMWVGCTYKKSKFRTLIDEINWESYDNLL